jgi:ribosomal protein S18 acetylase RimI-like enzyme
MIEVRPVQEDDRKWIHPTIRERWGSEIVAARGVVYEPALLPGFVVQDENGPIGLLTYVLEGDECEIVSIDAFKERRGVGTALIDAAKDLGARRLWLITTNDNVRAQRFYERCGFHLVAVHEGAVARSRELKPEIPLVAADGTPIRDELEYELIPP